MLIRKEVFEKIGYLPEEYFMYYEDVDFCINASKHFKLAAYGKSEIYHKVSASSGGQESPFAIKWNTRNRIIFIDKYCNKYKVKLFFYLSRIIVLIKYLLKGKATLCKALINGIKEGRRYINENKKI
jgi:GT2 family glycosyltransferase